MHYNAMGHDMPGIMFEDSDAQEMAPVYVLRGGPFERFLYFDSEHYWRVGSCEYKDQDTFGSFGFIWHIWRM
jgi:hypothetical protein